MRISIISNNFLRFFRSTNIRNRRACRGKTKTFSDTRWFCDIFLVNDSGTTLSNYKEISGKISRNVQSMSQNYDEYVDMLIYIEDDLH